MGAPAGGRKALPDHHLPANGRREDAMKKFSLTPSQKIMEGVCVAVLLGMVLGPIMLRV